MTSALNNIPFLSIIVPAYNEGARLGPTLEKIAAFTSRQSFSSEIIVVDDGSTDGTRALAEAFAAKNKNTVVAANPGNQGKGAAVKRGMLLARGKWRLFTDADSSTPIEFVNTFFPLADSGYDVVIGSRRVRGADVAKRQPFYRQGSGNIFSVLVRLLLLRGFIDTQCGFKLFSGAAAELIFPRLTIDGFGFDVEVLYIAVKRGLRVKEAPVRWIDSPYTHVHLVRDAAKMFTDLLRIRLNDKLGKY